MNIPAEVQALCQALLGGLNAALGEKFYSAYLYGAIAFPEAGVLGDIDFHVVLTAALNDEEKAALHSLHAELARYYPPLGAQLDGYYLLLEEVREAMPPRHQLLEGLVDNAWALHRAHIRAGRCIVLHGPDPARLVPEPTWIELEAALRDELTYVEQHLTDYPAYCVLNLCRLMYSYTTRDVVISKLASARWAIESFPAWSSNIEMATRCYQGSAAIAERQTLKTAVKGFYDFALGQIQESR